MIANALTTGTSVLSSMDKEVIPTLTTTAMPKHMENSIFMENPNPTETPLMMEALLLPQNPKVAPCAQKNPSSGSMEPPLVDNGLSNETLVFASAKDFHPRSQGDGMKTLEVTDFPRKLRLSKHVFYDQHIKFRRSRKKKPILSTNIADSLSHLDSVSLLEMPREVLSEAL
ncbi:hypothetical protein ACH5RR_018151 [Cinchona calisaya]|uniref:Uncharacterized protein n=1 Tax=Cinchona calisaya TaxID=153742 RepID=A0ABD2ZKM2_9GENT